jgi:hypothetical protein
MSVERRDPHLFWACIHLGLAVHSNNAEKIVFGLYYMSTLAASVARENMTPPACYPATSSSAPLFETALRKSSVSAEPPINGCGVTYLLPVQCKTAGARDCDDI